MGDAKTLSKARQELEDLYLGVPDDSVSLSFKDLASNLSFKDPPTMELNAIAEKKITHLEPMHESQSMSTKEDAALGKSPSLDFKKGLANVKHHLSVEGEMYPRDHTTPNNLRNKGTRNMVGSSMAYDDVSHVVSTTSRTMHGDRGGRRRLGIPHSNICTICSVYIYIFRNRCLVVNKYFEQLVSNNSASFLKVCLVVGSSRQLVCGRVYCRQCVSIGMGEMTEGRKCIECLGRRFSARYIKRAGNVGCCSTLPSRVKQQELRWAEKGPRRISEKGYGRSGMVSRSISPMGQPRTPTRSHVSTSPSSFAIGSPYSPSHKHPPIPF